MVEHTMNELQKRQMAAIEFLKTQTLQLDSRYRAQIWKKRKIFWIFFEVKVKKHHFYLILWKVEQASWLILSHSFCSSRMSDRVQIKYHSCFLCYHHLKIQLLVYIRHLFQSMLLPLNLLCFLLGDIYSMN